MNTQKFNIEYVLWVVGFVVVTVANYFVQMYNDGALPFKIAAGTVNVVVFVAGVVRWAMLLAKDIKNRNVDVTTPPDVVKTKEKKDS